MENLFWLIGIPAIIFMLRQFIQKFTFHMPFIFLKTIFWLFISSWALFIFGLILSNWNIYFRGYQSSTIVFLIGGWISIIFYVIYNRSNIPKFINYMILIPSLMLGSLTIYVTQYLIYKESYDLYYNDSKFRLEQTFKGILAMASAPDLFVKNGLFEKRYELSCRYIPKESVTKIKIEKINAHKLKIEFVHTDTSFTKENPIIAYVNIK